ncbi:MAG TPA: TonB-dependent receptor [Vicinamibacteria bacterium]|nr:TonB-dependent receptor [Vicinamibacteria bacterium]
MISRSALRAALACLAALAAATPPLVAQTFRGGIRGSVRDTTGALVPGATVTATDDATRLSRSTVSDAGGEYALSELPLGNYTVSASLSGFATRTVKGVRVETSATSRVDFVLEAGGRAESVEVLASATLVDSTSNTQGGRIDGKQAAELPVNGRDFTHLLSLVPGATSDPGQVSDSPGSFGYLSVNGNRGRANNFLLDGTDMNDGYRNDPAINEAGVFGTPATILPVDAVDEFPVLSGVEAEYGRNAGAIVNIVTRSGTNELHGSAFEDFRNDALGARNYFNTVPSPKNEFQNHQFGASLGGPLVKDRTFFFLAYEGQREKGGLPSLARVPSADEIASAIAANGGAANPVIAGLLARNPWPAPNQPLDANGNNLQATTHFTNDVDSLIAKVDHHFRESDVLTVRYFYGNSNQSFPLSLTGGGGLPGYNTVTPTNVQLASASLTHVLSPKLLVELRGGYNRFKEDFYAEDRAFDPNSVGLDTGVTNPRAFGMPEIVVSGFTGIGSNRANPRGRVDSNYQGFANLSYNTGGHSAKLGFEYRRTTVGQYFDEGFRGKLKFASLDDFVAGRISDGGRSVRGDTQRDTYQNNYSFYAQDSYRVNPRLTLNLGLRWDYYGVIGEENGQFSIFDPATATVKPVAQLYPKDWNNISPRLSVAWDLSGSGQTVLRAGWGLYYDAFSQDFFVGQLPWNTFNPGPAYNDLGFSFSAVDQIAYGVPVFPADSFSAALPTLHGFPDVWTVDQKLQTPWVQNFSANVQRQLGRNIAAQVGYVGSIGRHLFRYRDINQLDPATGTAPYPDYEYINQFESTATSHYNALQAILKVHGWRGLTSTLNYTFSKSIDNASDGQDYVPNASQPDDSRHPENEKALSNFDSRHRLTLFFTWEIGAQKGHWLKAGWAINGVATAASGMPVNLNFFSDYNGTGEYFGRPDLVGNPYAGTGGPSRFLNLSAFALPCTPDGQGGCAGGKHIGNLGRNAFIGPHYRDLDLSLVKNTALGGRARLQLRVDAFNVLNHPNFSNPLLPGFSVDMTQNGINAAGHAIGYLPLTATPDVGSGNPFLGGGGPRNLQLSARLSF